MRPAIALVLCLGISAVVVRPHGRSHGSAPALRVAIDSEHRATIVLSGAPSWCREVDSKPCHAEPRGPRRKTPFEMGKRETVLTFYVGGAKFADSATAVDGEYQFSDTSVSFRPYYPLVPGVEYTAVAHVGDLHPVSGTTPDARAILTERVFIPADPIVSRTAVAAVYPTADTLPDLDEVRAAAPDSGFSIAMAESEPTDERVEKIEDYLARLTKQLQAELEGPKPNRAERNIRAAS